MKGGNSPSTSNAATGCKRKSKVGRAATSHRHHSPARVGARASTTIDANTSASPSASAARASATSNIETDASIPAFAVATTSFVNVQSKATSSVITKHNRQQMPASQQFAVGSMNASIQNSTTTKVFCRFRLTQISHVLRCCNSTEDDYLSCQQYKKESLPDLFRRFFGLKEQALEVSDDQVITQAIKALRVGQLHSHLAREHPKMLEELYENFHKFSKTKVLHICKLEQ
jgi:hypothetical protein